jgi:hypothetical protein
VSGLAAVQSTGAFVTASSVEFALTSSPTAGNVLVAFVTTAGGSTSTPPSGSWQKLFATITDTGSQEVLDCYVYVVQSGDGKDWTFTESAFNYISGDLYEITGASTTFTGWQSGTNNAANAAAQASPSLTPGVSGMLGLAYRATNETETLSSVSSGWTDQTLGYGTTSQYHSSVAASMNALSTLSAVSCTFTTAAAPDYGIAVTLLIPAAGGTSYSGSASQNVAFSESATGEKKSSGAASQAVTFGESATGEKKSSGSAAQAVTFGTSASGHKAATGAASQNVTFGESATGEKKSSGSASQNVAFGESATGSKKSSGTASQAIAFGLSAIGRKAVAALASLGVTFGTSASGSANGGANTATQLCQRIDSGSMTPVLLSASLINDRNGLSPDPQALCWQVVSDPLNEGQFLLVGWLTVTPYFTPGVPAY